MRVKKIISGMQTGVDQTALRKAKELGIDTGGWGPKDWWTEAGPMPWVGTEYGMKEHPDKGYVPRTHANTRDSDITVWFGVKSPGFWCTTNGCSKHSKQFIINPTPAEFRELVMQYETINVAGNRMRTNPQASVDCEAAFEALRAEGCKAGCLGDTCKHLEAIRKANLIID